MRDLAFGLRPISRYSGSDSTSNGSDKFGVIGKNGKGKTTLLHVMSGGLPPVRGEILTHPNLRVGYFGQTNIHRLYPALTIEEEI